MGIFIMSITTELPLKELAEMAVLTKPSMANCIKYEKRKLMKFTGNQHNESWAWNTNVIKALPEEKLLLLLKQNNNLLYKIATGIER